MYVSVALYPLVEAAASVLRPTASVPVRYRSLSMLIGEGLDLSRSVPCPGSNKEISQVGSSAQTDVLTGARPVISLPFGRLVRSGGGVCNSVASPTGVPAHSPKAHGSGIGRAPQSQTQPSPSCRISPPRDSAGGKNLAPSLCTGRPKPTSKGAARCVDVGRAMA